MPDLEPVSGDPFAMQIQPVTGNPFDSMTHYAEQSNPAQPYVNAVKSFLQAPDLSPVHLPGTQPKDYLRELSQNPDILARTIDQAQSFASMFGMSNPSPISRLGRPGLQGQLGKFQLDDLRKDFEAGLNNRQIADKYNVTKEAIQRRRIQFGYPQKPRGRPSSAPQVNLEPVNHDPFASQ